MNIENDFIRNENFENIISHAYVNLVVRTKALSTKKLVFAIQTKVFHARFDSKSFEIKKQHEKFQKTFHFIVEKIKKFCFERSDQENRFIKYQFHEIID